MRTPKKRPPTDVFGRKLICLKLEFAKPHGATMATVKKFIKDNIYSGGYLEPDSVMFDGLKNVKITELPVE